MGERVWIWNGAIGHHIGAPSGMKQAPMKKYPKRSQLAPKLNRPKQQKETVVTSHGTERNNNMTNIDMTGVLLDTSLRPPSET